MHPCLDENCPGTCKLQHPTWLLDPPEWIHSKVLEGMLEFSMEEIRLHFLKSPANFFADWDSLFLNNYFLIYDKLNSMHKPISMSQRYFDLRRMNNPPMFDKSKFFEIKRRKSEKIEVEESILSYNERRNQGFGDRKKYSDDRKEYFDGRKKYSDDRQNFSERRNYEGRKDYYDGRKKYLDDRQNFNDRQNFSDRQNFDVRKKFTDERQNFSDRQNFDGRKKFTDERQNFSDRQNFNDRKYENKKPYFDDKRKNFHDKTYYDSKEKNYYDNKERNFYENKEKRNYYDKEKRSFKEKDFFYKKEDKKNDLMETKDDKIFKDFASEDELI